MAFLIVGAAPSGDFAPRTFTYACAGIEGDSFPIALPAARHATTYIAVVTLVYSPTGSQALYNAPPINYTTTQIAVVGPPPSAGDVLSINIQELSS